MTKTVDDWRWPDSGPSAGVDPLVRCDDCAACCCRKEVLLLTDTGVPSHLIVTDAWGVSVMERLDDGWCAALDRRSLRCSIYARRPQVCRDVVMGGDECQDARDEGADPGVSRAEALAHRYTELRACRRCPRMQGPPVHGDAVISPVMMIGQAPGTREIQRGIPFCWTAGKTLFRWFASIGVDEVDFRRRVLMSAVCRCFPGKNPKGGDRVPDAEEVDRCSDWWIGEIELARPRLIIPVGKLAIAQLVTFKRLNDVVGSQWHFCSPTGLEADLIPLPHPSGASTWFKMQPGKTLLERALALIEAHPAWQQVRRGPQ